MMAAQLDLFAGNQVDLFAASTPMADALAIARRAQLDLAVPAPVLHRHTGMPPSVEAAWARAWTAEVRQAFLDVAMQQPGEWIDSGRFYAAVAIPQNIGCCWGHAMGAMVRAGMLQSRPRYFGSTSPAEGNYQGYTHEYCWHVPMLGVAHA